MIWQSIRFRVVVGLSLTTACAVHGFFFIATAKKNPRLLSASSPTKKSLPSVTTLRAASNSSWFFAHDHHQDDDSSRLTTSTRLSSTATSTLVPDNDDDMALAWTDPNTPAPMWGHALDPQTKQFNKNLVHHIKGFLFDQFFASPRNSDNVVMVVERAYARFYALETIARMPYFSYTSVLHLLETLGLWRRAHYLKVHFAESWNELHHLLIMEELGGHALWRDRWVAQHVAFAYYWMCVALYLYNPTHAYHLNQVVEQEAAATYTAFIQQHAAYLHQQPAPQTAVEYYTGHDLTLFDAMHHHHDNDDEVKNRRRPVCNTLLDCFVNIRDDEEEHVKTMAFFQQGAE